jgi:hypothetical protein
LTISARELIAILTQYPDDTPIYVTGADVRIVWTDHEGSINLDEEIDIEDFDFSGEYTVLYEE